MTDNKSLQRKPLPVSSRAVMPAYNTCIHACLGTQRCSMSDDGCCGVLGLHHAAPLLLGLCQLVLFSCSTGHPLAAPKSPISPHVPFQTEECRPQASWTGLSSPKACAAQLIDFILSHFISFISCGFMSNCELDKKKVKPALFIGRASIVYVFLLCYIVTLSV